MTDAEPANVVIAQVAPEAVKTLTAAVDSTRVPHTQDQVTNPSVPANTTFQEDLTTAGQRAVNLIWENTQGKVALYVILGTMIIDGASVLLSMILGRDMTTAQALSLGFVNSLATGVVSFYFSRTNHAAIGGVGPQPSQRYQGR